MLSFGSLWQIFSSQHIVKVFFFTKNDPTNWRALKTKLFLKNASEFCQKKSLLWNLLVAKF